MFSQLTLLAQESKLPIGDTFIQYGIAGAVLAVVAMFLWHLREERKSRQIEDQRRDAHLKGMAESCHATHQQMQEKSEQFVRELSAEHRQLQRETNEVLRDCAAKCSREWGTEGG